MNLRRTFLLAVVMTALAVTADGLREGEVAGVADLQRVEVDQPVDLRTAFPVSRLDGDPALQGLLYSALGWELDAAADPSRTVTITAQAGERRDDGSFVPDGSAELTVLAATPGAGSCNWRPKTAQKKVYRLTHSVMKGGVVERAAILYGYLDFTDCDISFAPLEAIRAAVLGAITHPITVVEDEDWPWQPIDVSEARFGIVTSLGQEPGITTATAFTFNGCGVFHYEYKLSGGELAVLADREPVSTFTEPTAGWVSHQVSFDACGAHEVAFAYTAVGDKAAAIRNVRWEAQSEAYLTVDERDGISVDLQEGVRTPRRLAQVLPFQYSSTNWTGNVVHATAESVARVTIVQVTGTDPDVRTWTEEVQGTLKELVKEPGEGSVKWKPKLGCLEGDVRHTER